MATANPTLIHREDDNYEIELSRVREKIRAQFGDLTDRLKCRERTVGRIGCYFSFISILSE